MRDPMWLLCSCLNPANGAIVNRRLCVWTNGNISLLEAVDMIERIGPLLSSFSTNSC